VFGACTALGVASLVVQGRLGGLARTVSRWTLDNGGWTLIDIGVVGLIAWFLIGRARALLPVPLRADQLPETPPWTNEAKLQYEVEKMRLEVHNLRLPIWTAVTAMVALLGLAGQCYHADQDARTAAIDAKLAETKKNALDAKSTQLELEQRDVRRRIDSLQRVESTIATRIDSTVNARLAAAQQELDLLRVRADELRAIISHSDTALMGAQSALQATAPAGPTELQRARTAVGAAVNAVQGITRTQNQGEAALSLAQRTLAAGTASVTAAPVASGAALAEFRVTIYYPAGSAALQARADRLKAGLLTSTNGPSSVRIEPVSRDYLRRNRVPAGIQIRHDEQEASVAKALARTLLRLDSTTTSVQFRMVSARTPLFLSVFISD
jgi:hypothetical protein